MWRVYDGTKEKSSFQKNYRVETTNPPTHTSKLSALQSVRIVIITLLSPLNHEQMGEATYLRKQSEDLRICDEKIDCARQALHRVYNNSSKESYDFKPMEKEFQMHHRELAACQRALKRCQKQIEQSEDTLPQEKCNFILSEELCRLLEDLMNYDEVSSLLVKEDFYLKDRQDCELFFIIYLSYMQACMDYIAFQLDARLSEWTFQVQIHEHTFTLNLYKYDPFFVLARLLQCRDQAILFFKRSQFPVYSQPDVLMPQSIYNQFQHIHFYLSAFDALIHVIPQAKTEANMCSVCTRGCRCLFDLFYPFAQYGVAALGLHFVERINFFAQMFWGGFQKEIPFSDMVSDGLVAFKQKIKQKKKRKQNIAKLIDIPDRRFARCMECLRCIRLEKVVRCMFCPEEIEDVYCSQTCRFVGTMEGHQHWRKCKSKLAESWRSMNQLE